MEEESVLSKKCELRLIIYSTIYVFLFPFFLGMAFLSPMVADSSRVTSFFLGVTIFMMFCIPLSIPISIYFMWSRYFRKQYDKAHLFSRTPFYVTVIVFIFISTVPDFYYDICQMFALHKKYIDTHTEKTINEAENKIRMNI